MKHKNLPANSTALNRAFLSCERKGKLKAIDVALYSDYVERAQKDLASAERDFSAGDFHWARVKAYQSLFYLLNALLIKYKGYFSKDHGCVIIALMHENIITEETAAALHLLVKNALEQVNADTIYADFDEFRMQRNFALYKPKAWEDVKAEDVRQELDKIKENFQTLLRLL